jgi:hypothetical protein
MEFLYLYIGIASFFFSWHLTSCAMDYNFNVQKNKVLIRRRLVYAILSPLWPIILLKEIHDMWKWSGEE